jgi:hypothetical protein
MCATDRGLDQEKPNVSVCCPNFEGDIIGFSYSQGEPCKHVQKR